jgi:hypothetical protein
MLGRKKVRLGMALLTVLPRHKSRKRGEVRRIPPK